MSIVYNKSHTITFTKDGVEKNSWTDFHMVPSFRPYVVPPPPKFIFVNLPRSNTILDLTTALTNGVTFDVSEGDWEFYIDHDLWNSWSDSYDAISDFFDGSNFTAKLDDQKDYDYYGQIYVSNYIPGEDHSRVTLHYIFDVNLYGSDVGPTPPGPSPQQVWYKDVDTIVSLTGRITVDGVERLASSPINFSYDSQASTYRVTLSRNASTPIKNSTFYIAKYVNGSFTDARQLINEYTGSEDKIVATLSPLYFSNTNDYICLLGQSNFSNIDI